MKYKDGEFLVNTKTEKDGSLIQPTSDAKSQIEKVLKKRGADAEVISVILKSIDNAPVNTMVNIDKTMRIIKWEIETIQPNLAGDIIGDALPLKIAYEFLACYVGSLIYDRNVDGIREAIMNKKSHPELYKVEHLSGDYYKPFHGIVLEQKLPYVMIQIRLFGWIAYRVSFLNLGIDNNDKRVIYTLDLKQREGYLSYLE